MSMEFEETASVYQCSKCGARQIVLEGEQPPEECIDCGPGAERINKALKRVFEEEKDKLRVEGAASVLFPTKETTQ